MNILARYAPILLINKNKRNRIVRIGPEKTIGKVAGAKQKVMDYTTGIFKLPVCCIIV